MAALQISTSPVHFYYNSRDVRFICQWCTTTRCSSLHLLYIYQSQCRCTTIQVHLISCAVHCERYFTIWRRHVYIGKVHLFSRGIDVQIIQLHLFSCSRNVFDPDYISQLYRTTRCEFYIWTMSENFITTGSRGDHD